MARTMDQVRAGATPAAMGALWSVIGLRLPEHRTYWCEPHSSTSNQVRGINPAVARRNWIDLVPLRQVHNDMLTRYRASDDRA